MEDPKQSTNKIINPNREISASDLVDVEPVKVMMVLHKRVVDMENRMNYFRDVLANFEIQLEQNRETAMNAQDLVSKLQEGLKDDNKK